MKQDQERVRNGLKEAITLLCRTGLDFKAELCIEGLLGITMDNNEVFLVNIKEVIQSQEDDDKYRQEPGMPFGKAFAMDKFGFGLSPASLMKNAFIGNQENHTPKFPHCPNQIYRPKSPSSPQNTFTRPPSSPMNPSARSTPSPKVLHKESKGAGRRTMQKHKSQAKRIVHHVEEVYDSDPEDLSVRASLNDSTTGRQEGSLPQESVALDDSNSPTSGNNAADTETRSHLIAQEMPDEEMHEKASCDGTSSLESNKMVTTSPQQANEDESSEFQDAHNDEYDDDSLHRPALDLSNHASGSADTSYDHDPNKRYHLNIKPEPLEEYSDSSNSGPTGATSEQGHGRINSGHMDTSLPVGYLYPPGLIPHAHAQTFAGMLPGDQSFLQASMGANLNMHNVMSQQVAAVAAAQAAAVSQSSMSFSEVEQHNSQGDDSATRYRIQQQASRANKLGWKCSNCGTSMTTMWRRNDDGDPVCNPCGLYYKLHKKSRPYNLTKRRTQVRRRRRYCHPKDYHTLDHSPKLCTESLLLS